MKASETFWLTVIGLVQDVAILTSLVMFLINPKHARRQFKELGWVLFLSLAAEIISWSGILLFHTNMNLVVNIFRLVNLPLIIILYLNQTNWKSRRTGAYIFIAVFEALALTNLFFVQGVHGINSYTSSFSCFCVVLISITYLFAVEFRTPGESRAMHWINIAFLFYCSSTLFIFLWVDYLVNVLQSNLIGVWKVHNTLGIIFYAILSYALLVLRKQSGSHRVSVAT